MTVKGLRIESLGGYSPVQAFGVIGAFPFYFRARWDRWTFAVATGNDATKDDAVATMVGRQLGFVLSKQYGEQGGYDAGAMLEEEATSIIEQCAEAFLATLYSVKARQER